MQLFNMRNQLSVNDDFLVYADRIAIPTSMRSDMLDHIHQGITNCIERIRKLTWWLEITIDVKQVVVACEHCQTRKPSQTKEPLTVSPIRSRPWEKLGLNLCLYGGQNYFVMVDCYSRCIEVLHIRSTTTAACAANVKVVFTRFGVPDEIIFANGTPFASSEFRSFVESNWITLSST